MSTIIYSTDHHLTDRQPPSRKDNYFESVSDKWKQIGELARKHDASMIISGGDMVHVPNENYRVFCRYLDILKSMPVKVETIIGLTHDFSQNEKNIEKSILWALKEAGVLTLHSQSNTWCVDGVKLHSAHMTISPVPFFGHYILYKDITVDADIIMTSHLHMPFGISNVECNDGRTRTFVSPGSIARNTCDIFNLNRKPQVAIIDIYNGKYNVELVELDVPTDVFDEEYILSKEQDKNQSEIRSIDEINEFLIDDMNVDIDSIMQKLGNRYSKEIIDMAILIKSRYT